MPCSPFVPMSLGLVDLVIVAGASYLLYRTAQRQGPQPAEAGTRRWRGLSAMVFVPAEVRAPAGAADLVRAIVEARRSDRDFFPEAVERAAAECFRLVHTALVMREAGNIRGRLTPEMYVVLKGQVADLTAARRFRHVERLEIESARLVELWQERGQDFATVHVVSRLVDYTTDAAGAVVAGSKTTPVRVAQGWTFTRPMGPYAWRLAAIEQR
jgi:predicted lipid-binding transport protein (Tim44 family)